MFRYVLAAVPTFLASASTGLIVESGTPDALCPDLDTTRKAVEARLGVLEVERGAGWRAVYYAGHAPEKASGDFLRLELFDPEGQLKLRRDLPRGSESCATMAQVVAVVVERYFHSLAGAASAGETDQQPPSDATPPAGVSAAASSAPPSLLPDRATPAEPAPILPSDPSAFRTWMAGGGAAFDGRGPSLELVLRTRLSSSFEMFFKGAIPSAERSERIGPGTAYMNGIPLRVGAAWLPYSRRLQVAAGPEALLAVERGRTEGIASTARGTRMVLGLGPQAELRFWVTDGVALSLGGALDAVIPLSSSQFVVSGREVLDPGWLRGQVSLGVCFAWWGEGWGAPRI